MRTRLVKALGSLLNNPWEPVTIESIDTSVRVTFAREVVTLRGDKLLETEVDAGQPVKIRLDPGQFGNPHTLRAGMSAVVTVQVR